jgi:signal peptidase I
MRLFASIFSLNGVATAFAAMMAWLFAVAVQVLMVVLGEAAPDWQRYFWPLLGLATVALFTTSARRLHHAGHSGRWALLTLVPLLGLLVGLIIALLPQRRTRIYAHNGARLAGYAGIVLLLALSLWRVWWTPYWIVSESMKPALLVGDYILTRAIAPQQAARGDVVLLRSEIDNSVQIKRLIGLGGDKISLSDGIVYINGTAAPQDFLGQFTEVMAPQGPLGLLPRCENGLVGAGGICKKTHLLETLPSGRSYMVLNVQDGGPADSFAEITVPTGHVFVLGDNRDNSLDSRFVPQVGGLGILPQERIIASARRVLISAEGTSLLYLWTWRFGRIWHMVD